MALKSLTINLGWFGISSATSCLVDNVLFWLFFDYAFGAGYDGRLFWSMALARFFSLIYNFGVNKIVVFRFQAHECSVPAGTVAAALKYFALAVCIMLSSYGLTKLFCWVLCVRRVICVKLLVDAFLFICSYIVQKRFVFRGCHDHSLGSFKD